MKIRILEKCRAAEQHLPQGAVLAVPEEIPETVARALVRMRRAEEIASEEFGGDENLGDDDTEEFGDEDAPVIP